MRVLILTQEFPSDKNPQACNFILEQIRELRKYAEIIVVSPVYRYLPLKRYSELRNSSKDIPIKTVVDNITIYRPRYIYLPWLFKNYNIYNFVSAVEKIIKKEKIDIIHSHFAHVAGYVGSILKKKYGIPLIVNVHGADINRFILAKEGGEITTKRAVSSLEMADAIIAVSMDLANKTASVGGGSKKIHMIYNGIPLDMFYPGKKIDMRKKLNLPIYKKILFFAGNVIEQKGVFDFLDAIGILSRWRDDILIVFAGKDGTSGKFTEKIKSNSDILYVGQINHDLVPFYMQSADLLVHPSHSEGFGIVIAESLACGLPVISTCVGAIPEILSSENLGILVEPGKPKILANAIEEGLNKRFDQNFMIEYSKRFSIKKNVSEVIKLYNSLI